MTISPAQHGENQEIPKWSKLVKQVGALKPKVNQLTQSLLSNTVFGYTLSITESAVQTDENLITQGLRGHVNCNEDASNSKAHWGLMAFTVIVLETGRAGELMATNNVMECLPF